VLSVRVAGSGAEVNQKNRSGYYKRFAGDDKIGVTFAVQCKRGKTLAWCVACSLERFSYIDQSCFYHSATAAAAAFFSSLASFFFRSVSVLSSLAKNSSASFSSKPIATAAVRYALL